VVVAAVSAEVDAEDKPEETETETITAAATINAPVVVNPKPARERNLNFISVRPQFL
jgi:hypothetical protein